MTLNVCMITYNHENFIAQAIEGVLMQKTKFSFNLIIGEDYSTDKTREICISYAAKFPDLIQLITSDTNVGMQDNFLRTYKACTATYIGFCEGDDYWTDPLKLQKQLDFLDANNDYSACFHNVILKTERGNIFTETVLHKTLAKDSFTTEDVLGPWFIPSPSIVFRNYPDFQLPDWFKNCRYGDLPLMLLLTLRGKFRYLDEVMGVYRLHDNGMSIYHKAYDKIMLMVYIYSCFDIHTNYQFHHSVRNAVQYEVDRHIPPKEPINESVNGNHNLRKIKYFYRKMKQRLNGLA